MRVAALITNLAMANALFAVNPGAKETTADTKPTEQHEVAIDKPRSAKQTLDSTPFNTVLEKYLKQGRIGYEEFKADKDAVAQLQAYVDAIARMPEAEPLASWINAYNAIVIHAILERFPLESVKNAEGGDFRFFREIRYIVAGKERSLDDIENGIFRSRFEDARIHVALNCGALSCPPLAPQAFESETLDADLDRLSKIIVNEGHHVYLKNGKLVVNEIFKWFEGDFVRDGGSLLKWIQFYSDNPRIKELAPDVTIEVYPYDWSLAAEH